MRVLHVIQNLNYGGMERLLADIVLQANPERFESHVLVLQYLGRFSEGLEHVATLHVAEPMSRFSMIRPLRLAGQIRRIAPDVVHTHSGVWFKASAAARMAGVPRVIHTEHGRQAPDPWKARFLDGLASRRTDVAVAVSAAVGEVLERDVVRGGCRVEVVLNGTDTDAFRPVARSGQLRRELGLGDDAVVLGSVGRLEPIKGYDVMIEAFSRLAGSPSAAKVALVIVGDGSERTRLDERVRDLGLGGRVHLLGWRDDTARLLPEFDLFTMSSRSEGTSVSLLEAMSSGLCPVVTAVGGNPAVLGSALSHRLVPSEDPDALAAGWVAALADPDRLRREGREARDRICASYSSRAMVTAYERLYAGPARIQSADATSAVAARPVESGSV